jgi:hypothetical protein
MSIDAKDMKAAVVPGDLEEAASIQPGSVSSGDVDIAATYANQFVGENAYTKKEETRLRWKLDLRLVPLLWFNVTLGAMDKVTTATAALYGFRADTGLTGNRYSWVGSAFYVSEQNPWPRFPILITNKQLSSGISSGVCLPGISCNAYQLPNLCSSPSCFGA